MFKRLIRFFQGSSDIDMCNGPVMGKLLLFAVPLMLSGMLQLLFNAADVVVVGQFCGSLSLAAVGSNGALVNLLVNLFIGISVGTNVLVAKNFARQHADSVFRAVHSAILLSVIIGIFVGTFGAIYAPQLLHLVSVPDDVLPLAATYLRIYFLGMPATVVYNFGAAILRAVGDTKHPLYYLTTAGVVNVVTNLILVCIFHMDVAGVAIASALSQYVAAFLTLRCLTKKETSCRLSFKMLRFYKKETLEMIRIGVPAGLQSTIFSFSNVLIQSSVNTFGSTVIAGHSAAGNIDQMIYIAMNSISNTAVSFISQNLGAGKMDRLPKIVRNCYILVLSVGCGLCATCFLLGRPLLSIFTPEKDVIEAGMIRLTWVTLPYFLCGVMDVGSGLVRGMGRSWLSMAVSTFGACVLRIAWVYTIFAWNPTLQVLYLSYPCTWSLTAAVHGISVAILLRQIRRHKAAAAVHQMPPLEITHRNHFTFPKGY